MSDSTKMTPEERLKDDPRYPEVLTGFLALLADDGLTVAQAARESGIPESSLAHWKNDSGGGIRRNTTEKVAKFVATKAALKNPTIVARRSPGFQETPTAQAFCQRFEYAQSYGKMVVCTGNPAVGKTTAAREYQARGSNVFIATLRPSARRLTAVLGRILASLALPPRNGAQAASDAILAFLKPRRALLIIDEAHFADLDALEEIRSWSDEVSLGIALVGDHTLMDSLGKSGRNRRDQLSSRVRQALFVKSPDRADIKVILDGWMLTDRLARNAAAAVAQSQDGLRGLEEVLELSFALAAMEGAGEPTAGHIDEANKSRGAGGAA